MTRAASEPNARLDYLKTCNEFVPRLDYESLRDPDGAVYLELAEIPSGESLGFVFPNGFMTAVKCLDVYASSHRREVSPRLCAQMRELAARLHDGRCGYRFFQDSRRYPEDVDSTAVLNATLLISGDLTLAARKLAQDRLLGSRTSDGGFSVWLAGGAANRPMVRDPVVDMNTFAALVLLSGEKAEFYHSFERAAAQALAACERGDSLYYNNLLLVEELVSLWRHIILGIRQPKGELVTERFRGHIVAQHRDGTIGYVVC